MGSYYLSQVLEERRGPCRLNPTPSPPPQEGSLSLGVALHLGKCVFRAWAHGAGPHKKLELESR